MLLEKKKRKEEGGGRRSFSQRQIARRGGSFAPGACARAERRNGETRKGGEGFFLAFLRPRAVNLRGPTKGEKRSL